LAFEEVECRKDGKVQRAVEFVEVLGRAAPFLGPPDRGDLGFF
jgi:hypothetical protein